MVNRTAFSTTACFENVFVLGYKHWRDFQTLRYVPVPQRDGLGLRGTLGLIRHPMLIIEWELRAGR